MFIRWKLTERLPDRWGHQPPPTVSIQVCRSAWLNGQSRLTIVKHLGSLRLAGPGQVYPIVCEKFWKKARVRLNEIPNLSEGDRARLIEDLRKKVPEPA